MENFKARSKHAEGSGHSLSSPYRTNWDPTPSGDSSPILPIYNHMQFSNHTLRPSGDTAVVASRAGWSLGSIPRNRSLEKVDDYGRGDLDG